MNTTFGKHISVEVYGSSHSACVGAYALGFPAGIAFSKEELRAEMARRAPGRALTSSRREPDDAVFLSGVSESETGYVTDGSPIRLEIANRNVRLSDYQEMDYFRPSHGDYTYSLKYPGRADNHPSGRMTAPLVPLGLIAARALGISFLSHIKQIGPFTDECFPREMDEAFYQRLHNSLIPVVSESGEQEIAYYISETAQMGDSCGAMVETMVQGVPAGLGEPFFRGLDGVLSQAMFSIPGLRAFSLGDALIFPSARGSEVNDAFFAKDGCIMTKTNHSGGINAGISNGMPIVFSVVFRPTPSISKPQETVDASGKNRTVSITGRHDPCFALRAIPAVEALAAMALLDLSLDNPKKENLTDLRQEISSIDNRLAALLKERARISGKIGELKKDNCLAVYQPDREQAETERILKAYFENASEKEKEYVAAWMNDLYRYSRFIQGDTSERD